MDQYERNGTAPPIVAMTADQARQGVTGHGVRYVLAFGLLGIIVALAAVFLIL